MFYYPGVVVPYYYPPKEKVHKVATARPARWVVVSYAGDHISLRKLANSYEAVESFGFPVVFAPAAPSFSEAAQVFERVVLCCAHHKAINLTPTICVVGTE